MRKLENKKLCAIDSRLSIHATAPRVYRRKKRGTKSARILVKCGDCDRKIEIYPASKDIDRDMIEIGGVLAHKEHWKMLFKEAGIL